ncbi:colicin E3/pyocin S6 family cytotoxin, partial [Nocardioides sp. NPDC101246]|uniref:colicin E3/pyocin S6 family cytotoxin n=1 Tax=Nocardioides sp. NPDC101246 TaxID=3364336 RepID=UPI00382E99E8
TSSVISVIVLPPRPHAGTPRQTSKNTIHATDPARKKACKIPGNSFTASTLVAMADGSRRPIKDVSLGDLVIATNPVTGESGPRKVVDLIRHYGPHVMVAVRLADGTTIDATDEHPFWVTNRGDSGASGGSWVDAIDLRFGDRLVTNEDRQVLVVSAGVAARDLMAYNLTIEGLHTFFVSEIDVLVHNDYVPAPSDLPGFPGARRDTPKTPKKGGGLRKRWSWQGKILEWDYQHGEVEMYDKRGKHLGAFDPETGDNIKGSVPGRECKR